MKKMKTFLMLIAVVMVISSCQKTPEACISSSASTANVNESITFTNCSIESDHYEWTFGDGSSSSEESPSHIYTTSGTYTVTLTAFSKNGKKTNEATTSVTINGAKTITVSGEITSNTTWSSDNQYVLSGFVYVVDGVTLTIQAGTIIKGDKDSKGSLIIERGAKLNAQGTALKPIVFTSNQPAGSRNRGDWGGVIICGKATINVAGGEAQIEGGPRTFYGGSNDTDNSGILQYIRIEFAGIALQPDKEVNGLTLGGVGNGTTIDHIQVSFCGDDSFEFFGGTVNCKNLIAWKGYDDEFDTDYGYRGIIQFGVSMRDSGYADVSGSNGFESDNDGTGSSNSPFTSALFVNMSVFGPKATATNPIHPNYKRAMHIRRNSRLSVYNSIITGYPTGLLIDGSATEANMNNNDLQIENTIIAGANSSSFFAVSSTSSLTANDIRTWFKSSTRNNDTLATSTDLQISDAFNYSTPNFLPSAGSPALSGASFSNSRLSNSFIQSVSYRGAFGNTDWTSGWANFIPESTVY